MNDFEFKIIHEMKNEKKKVFHWHFKAHVFNFNIYCIQKYTFFPLPNIYDNNMLNNVYIKLKN